MSTAIDRFGPGNAEPKGQLHKERDVNARFLAMASHYMFYPERCNNYWNERSDWSGTIFGKLGIAVAGREMLEILALVLQHDDSAVPLAIETALGAG